jgi:hypothetical protein
MRELYRRYRGPRPGNRIRFLNRGKVPPPAAAGQEETRDEKKPETPAPKAS